MGMFQGDCQTGHKAKKRIHQLKRELASLTGDRQWSDMNYDTGEVAGMIKEKGRQAFNQISDHASEMKEKAKDNPKTALAVIAGIGLAACLLMRKN